MFAIVELGGKQYMVREKDVLRVETVNAEVGKSIACNKVLLTANEDAPKIGTPYISGAEVKLKVLVHGRGEKIRIFKMKAKKRYRKLRGHRQPFSEVVVEKINV